MFVHHETMKKNNKLTKIETRRISQKLSWTLKETEIAIEEFKNIKSLVNHNEVFRICLKSNSPNDRESNLQFLINNLEGDVIDNIIALNNSHQFLTVLRIFNLIDIKNSGFFELEYRLSRHTEVMSGSFLRYPPIVIARPVKKDIKSLIKYGLLNQIIFTSENRLFNELINGYIQHKATRYMINSDLISNKDSTIDNTYENYFKFIEEIIIKLIPILEFEIFNINCLRDHINILSHTRHDTHNNEVLKIIKKKFIELEINRNEITDKTYWFYYCLIEKIKQSGYKTKPASQIAENFLRVRSRGTLRARYYEKNKEVKKNKSFNLDRYIIEQGFLKEIDKYIEKLGPDN